VSKLGFSHASTWSLYNKPFSKNRCAWLEVAMSSKLMQNNLRIWRKYIINGGGAQIAGKKVARCYVPEALDWSAAARSHRLKIIKAIQ
jgi:hypothetical protein